MDAFEKLGKLALKQIQEREIIKVLVHTCMQEKSFNPYYALVAEKFCTSSHSFKVTFQYTLWDSLKAMLAGNGNDEDSDDDSGSTWEMDAAGIRKTRNLAKMTAFLVTTGCVSLSVTRVKRKREAKKRVDTLFYTF